MKFTKIFALILATISMLTVFALGSFGESSVNRLVDGADLLTDAEEQSLTQKLDEASERLGFDFLIVTVNETGNKDILSYADDYHAGAGYNEDAAMLIIDMSDREWYVATYGFGNRAVTSEATYDYLEGRILSYLSAGEYEKAFENYLSGAEKLVSEGQQGNFYEDWIRIPWGRNIFIALVFGMIIALLVVFSMRSKLKTVAPKHTAGGYVKQGSFNLRREKDLFLFRTHTRTYSPRQRSSGGGSGGGSRGGGGGHF